MPAFAILLALLLPVGPLPAEEASGDWEVRIASENDSGTGNEIDDDFYTFGALLELSVGDWTVSWTENAYTDRVEELRFDESYLTVGTLLPEPWVGEWGVWLEAGVAHVGEGLLGQSFQNDVHDLTGHDPIVLDYIDRDELYPHLDLELGRQFHLVEGEWTWGPQLGVGASFGFRTNALAGLRTIWRPSRHFGLDVTVGGRYADSELDELSVHLEETGATALVRVDLPWGFYAGWSLNRYGTGRRHISLGLRIGPGESPRRRGSWIEAGATP